MLLWSPRHWRRDKGWRSCVPSCSCNQVRTDKEVAFAMAWSTCGSKEDQRCNVPDRRSGQPQKTASSPLQSTKAVWRATTKGPATWSAYWPAFQFTSAETSSPPSLCSGWDWSHVCRRYCSWRERDISKSWGRGLHRGRSANSRTSSWSSASPCHRQTEKRSSCSCLDERLYFFIFEWTLINFLAVAAIRVDICYSGCTPSDFYFA